MMRIARLAFLVLWIAGPALAQEAPAPPPPPAPPAAAAPAAPTPVAAPEPVDLPDEPVGFLSVGTRGFAYVHARAPSSWELHLPARGRYVLYAESRAPLDLAVSSDGVCRVGEPSRDPEKGAVSLLVEAARRGECVVVLRTTSADDLPYRLSLRCVDGRCRHKRGGACGPAEDWDRVSVRRFIARPDVFADQPVRLDGRTAIGPAMCTRMACPDGCCNRCSAPLGFRGRPRWRPGFDAQETFVRLDGLACTGNECDLRQHCTFRLGVRLTAWGEARSDEHGRSLAVEGACGPD